VISLRHIEKRVLSREGTLALERSSSETVLPSARDYDQYCREILDERRRGKDEEGEWVRGCKERARSE